jgi:NAD(P)-dependent dehydrogenase (short-subunit alcohol dehydrogenase family)
LEGNGRRDPGRRLTGRVAWVTGAGGGIGAAVCARLAQEGAAVLATDLDGAAVSRVTEQILADGHVVRALPVDVTRAEDRAAAVAAAVEMGGLHILVNAAGIIAPQMPLDIDEATWRKVFAINADGLYFCCQAAIPVMRAQHYGRIVNFSSTGAIIGTTALVSYNAAKASVLAVTRGLAAEFGRDGITVNTVLPGIVDTSMWETINAEVGPMIGFEPGKMLADRVSRIPLGRPGRPDDVASVVAFFASDDAGYVTGQSLNVCGGLLMR